MPNFARVTEPDGKVQWINLDHVRQLVVKKGTKEQPVFTTVHIDNSWVERVVAVIETPEQILDQARTL